MQLSAINAALGRFLAELQRRKVLRVAATYLVGAWIVLQVAVALQTAMSLSASFSGAILALLVIGFPAALVVSWFFEITPEGIKRTAPASGDLAPFKPQTIDLVLAGVLGLVIAFALVQLATSSGTTTAPTTTTAEAAKPKPEPPALGDKSIAVLAFANLSPDKENEYFADGLTEELLNLLAKIPDLKVISRTSSFAFKGKDTPLPEIAKVLGVRHILEGSVRRDGEDIRVTAQLIDVLTDTHLWSQTFDRKFVDVFGVQDDVARAIAGALNIELLVPISALAPPTTNMEAYSRYLKANYEFGKFTREGVLASIDLAKEAIALDPKFADAYGRLAVSYDLFRSIDRTLSTEYAAKSREAADTALRLNPRNEWVAIIRVFVALADFDWDTAATIAKTQDVIAFSHFDALLLLAHTQMALGHTGSAARSFEQAAVLDPLSRPMQVVQILSALARGDNAKVESLSTRQQSWASSLWAANFALALVAQEKGEGGAAEKHFRAAMRVYPQNFSIIEPVVRVLRHGARWRNSAVKALRREADRDPEFDLEDVYLLTGDTDSFLETATLRLLSKRDSAIGTQWQLALMWHLVARGYGDNPRLKSLFHKIGLVDYWKKHGWPDRCRAKGEDDFECS